jgi:prepilin-type N-terminal cleavage/methylation domain-containing protein
MQQVRRHDRITIRADVTIQPGDQKPDRFACEVFNISTGGLGIFTSRAFAPGRLVGLEFIVPVPDEGIRRISLFGVTRWMQVLPEGNILGVELLSDSKAGDYQWFADNFDSYFRNYATAATKPWSQQGGFTLVELSITMVIICLLMTLAAPMFTRAIEQARLDSAAANLKTVWSAQRVYWLEYRSFTTQLSALRTMDLIDPVVAGSSSSGSTLAYTYDIPNADASTFTARASRNGSAVWRGQIQIDQDGDVSGAITGADSSVLLPVR